MATISSKVAQLFSENREGVTQMLFKSRVEELVLQSLEDLVSQDRKKMLTEIGRNWDFYYGEHEPYFKKYREEDADEYADKAKPEFNYTRLIIDEYPGWLKTITSPSLIFTAGNGNLEMST